MSCHFDKTTLSFAGSPLAQARCLLRHVNPGGDLGEVLDHLPQPLESLIGEDVSLSRDRLLNYLTQHEIAEADIGGRLSEPLSRAHNNSPDAPFAKYFVIHDTSSPNLCTAAEFPPNINDPDWTWKGVRWNDLEHWRDSDNAHMFITRSGKSVGPQGRTFRTAWRATKLEGPKADVRAKGLFLHIENVQPRRCLPDMHQPAGQTPDRRYFKLKEGKWECRNDHFAPNPGLSDPQLDRLALVYTAASIRGGHWLIPGFHAAVDDGIADSHDDPQFFDLARWVERLQALLTELA